MRLGASTYYNETQLKGLNKLGDVVVPKNGRFPAFSETGCFENIDKVMSPAAPSDIKSFGYLLLVFCYLPSIVISLILSIADKAERMPRLIAPPFRMLNISLRGVIFSLYYSDLTASSYTGPSPHEAIDYQVSCKPDPRG